MIFPGKAGFPGQRMDAAAFHALVGRATVIERDGFGEKVLQTPEGLMVKIFRRKRLLTSAALFPYARRFIRNARLLAERGIPTVSVAGYAYCPALGRHVVTYHPLPGRTLRSCLQSEGRDPDRLLAAVAVFMAALHRQGVYFRSLHFGNIIVTPEMTFGLIDMADMTIGSKPLDIGRRARNFRHLVRYREDTAHLQGFGCARFLEEYLESAGLAPRSRRAFLGQVGKTPVWSEPAAVP